MSEPHSHERPGITINGCICDKPDPAPASGAFYGAGQGAEASGADAALTVTIPVAEFARLLDAIERIEAALTPPPPAEPTLQAALAAVGLPETASVADLIRHHRNNEAAANGAWKLAYDALAAKSPAEPTLDERLRNYDIGHRELHKRGIIKCPICAVISDAALAARTAR